MRSHRFTVSLPPRSWNTPTRTEDPSLVYQRVYSGTARLPIVSGPHGVERVSSSIAMAELSGRISACEVEAIRIETEHR